MSSSSGTLIVAQSDFDKFVEEFLSEGQTLNEAVSDTLDMFGGGTYDVRALFVYESKDELEVKNKLQSSIHTITQASKGCDTFVNASFALGALVSLLKSSENMPLRVQQGVCRMCEAEHVLHAMLTLIGMEEEEDENSDGESDGGSNGLDDEYKASIVLDIVRYMFDNCSDNSLEPLTGTKLTEDCCIGIAIGIDNNSHIKVVIEKFMYILSQCFTIPANLVLFREKTDGFKHFKSALRLSAKRESQLEFTTDLQRFIEKYE